MFYFSLHDCSFCLYIHVFESLLKMRVRLGASKTGLSSPVVLSLLIVPSRYFCCGSICFIFWSRFFVLFEPCVSFHSLSEVRVTEWPTIGKELLTRLTYMFSKYENKYKILTVNLMFSHLGFWSRCAFLIAPFPDHCLLVPF